MGQILGIDNIPTLVVASTTTLTFATTNLGQPVTATVGGQQYSPSSTITLNCATTGANGLDTGGLAASTTYYVYAIVNNSTFALALVASTVAPSTGPTMPSGYGTAYKAVGSFTTNGNSQVAAATLEVQNVYSGMYTPTLTVTGATATASAPWQWFRVGNKVTVWGYANLSSGASSQLTWTLPITPSTFSTAASNLARCELQGYLMSDTAIIQIEGANLGTTGTTSSNAPSSANGLRFHFSYRL